MDSISVKIFQREASILDLLFKQRTKTKPNFKYSCVYWKTLFNFKSRRMYGDTSWKRLKVHNEARF